ncbi:hypothetical protein P8192_00885 [Citricoccus muralis]|uniref:Uncharacterized protein n=1 Tax=Citricoccus muralis TaxID=169134 RepID=A0ABY8H6F0_9MICC|nr:hypothetical protein [Citricoccus muralis]WFP16715.1 hypothetical protein P8192_00885 [Citricoccus muralis]
MSPYIRKVRTASGATAVQIVEKRRGTRRILEHLGSAHTPAELVVLMQLGQEKLNAGQQVLDLDLPAPEHAEESLAGAVVTGTVSQVLWDVLADAYTYLGFDGLEDDAFRSMVLARIIEPASKLATTGILEELGVPALHHRHSRGSHHGPLRHHHLAF